MFIELTEHLRCPEDHEQTELVLATGEMSDRAVRWGTVGCPRCQREYPIESGVVAFAEPPSPPGSAWEMPEPGVLPALLDMSGPGGFVVLVGSAVQGLDALAAAIEGVHYVAVNAPGDFAPHPRLSRLTGEVLPLRTSMARGVVVGREWADDFWLREAVRVLLRGRRLVVLSEQADPEGVNQLAAGKGMWVGEKA